MAELLLNVALIDLCSCGEASAQRMSGESSPPFGFAKIAADAGVDVQVLSHGAPSGQALDGPEAAAIVARANDRIAEFIKTKPDRFSAFGALATCDPTAAADELERVVTRHGFKGAMIHGLTKGQFVDDRKFWPILWSLDIWEDTFGGCVRPIASEGEC